jgi:hypothetical protein
MIISAACHSGLLMTLVLPRRAAYNRGETVLRRDMTVYGSVVHLPLGSLNPESLRFPFSFPCCGETKKIPVRGDISKRLFSVAAE